MKKLLIVIDMQNDFIAGSLANPAAQEIVKPMAEFIEQWEGDIIFTQDTHYENYLETQEGKKLPIKHCIYDSKGWQIASDLLSKALADNPDRVTAVTKPTFGSLEWKEFLTSESGDCKYGEIYLCGTCTDICVVSNALILKTTFPEVPVSAIGNLCAGLTKEKHEAALEVMKSCQVEVI